MMIEPITDVASAQAPTSDTARPAGKLGVLVDLLSRPDGASVYDLAEAVGWQLHSVRGALAGALKTKGFEVTSEKTGQHRIYRLAPPKAVKRRKRSQSKAEV